MSDEDQLREIRAEEHERHAQAIKRQIDEIRPAYAQALTSLWLGNAGASLAVLSFIGASWRDGRFPHFLLIPLGCFVLGLVSMGIGSALWLWGAREDIRDTEDAELILDRRAFRAMRPSERAGLTWKDWRTQAALLSAALFALGCVAGLIGLALAH